MNLVQKYGPSWFNSKFNGSFFMRDGVLASVYDVDYNYVALKMYPKHRKFFIARAKHDEFPDSSVFHIPEMGYRTHDKGKWLCYLGRNNNSYHRGLRYRDITQSLSSLTQYLKTQTRVISPTEDEILRMVYHPNYIPLHTGIKLMLEGKLMSFAASASVAVIPDHESDGLLILMNENVVGRVDESGTLSYLFNYAAPYIEGKELQV